MQSLDAVQMVLALAVGLVGVIAFVIPAFLADWSYSKLAGWGVLAMMAATVGGTLAAPAMTRDTVAVVGWGLAFLAAILTRIAGHLAALAPAQGQARPSVAEGGFYVPKSDASKPDATA